MTFIEAAIVLGVSRKHLSSIINGHSPVTPDMAIRLAMVFETEAELRVNLQAQHDLWRVRQEVAPKLRSLRKAA